MSNGGVHSSIEHIYALLKLAKQEGLEEVYVHAFMDGRDVDPQSGAGFIDELTKSYTEGYLTFREQAEDIKAFYEDVERFKKELNAKGRNIASEEDLEMFNNLVLNIELSIHANWIEDFSNKYNN